MNPQQMRCERLVAHHDGCVGHLLPISPIFLRSRPRPRDYRHRYDAASQIGSWRCPPWVCAVTRRRFPVGASPTRRSLQPEAAGAAKEVTNWLKPSECVSRIGDSARVQAATRVNAEQASKRTMRRPTDNPFRGRLTRLQQKLLVKGIEPSSSAWKACDNPSKINGSLDFLQARNQAFEVESLYWSGPGGHLLPGAIGRRLRSRFCRCPPRPALPVRLRSRRSARRPSAPVRSRSRRLPPPPDGAGIPSIAGQFKLHLQASHDFIDL